MSYFLRYIIIPKSVNYFWLAMKDANKPIFIIGVTIETG